VVPIQEYEGRWLLPGLVLAAADLGTQAKICKVLVDRGYLDGEDLWELNHRGILFVIVAKAGMVVAEDAQSIAKHEVAQTRERVLVHGHGKKATQEILRTKLVGPPLMPMGARSIPSTKTDAILRGTRSTRWWCNCGTIIHPQKMASSRLANEPVDDPFTVFDDYDWRSVIENGIWKRGQTSVAPGGVSKPKGGGRGRPLPFHPDDDGLVYGLSSRVQPRSALIWMPQTCQ
jgi:hypothetical protein